MATYKREYDASLPRYNSNKKRELGTSMLEYAERMGHINAARGNSFRGHSKDLDLDADVKAQLAGITTQRQNLHRSEELFLRTRHPHYRHLSRREHLHKGCPLSFNSGDLPLRGHGEYHRPRRETKSERPIFIPSGLSDDMPDTPPVSEKQTKVSLVSASDLYDLVDFNKLARSYKDSSSNAKLADIGQELQLMEEMELISRRRAENRSNSYEKRMSQNIRSKHPGIGEPVANIIDVNEMSTLLSDEKMKNDFYRRGKYRSEANVNHELRKHDESAKLPVEAETELTADDIIRSKANVRNEEEIRKAETHQDEPKNPLDILLEQAVSKHAGLTAIQKISPRPKRAKRMLLHKPELLAIPEDNGTFVRADSNDAARQEMLASSIASSSTRSGQVIKDMTPRQRRGEGGAASDFEWTDIKPVSTYISDPKIDKSRRSRSRPSPDHVDLDEVTSTSVYPFLSWDNDNNRDLKLNFKQALLTKSNPKEKAHKKIRKLIFLREQPNQNYRREI